MGITRDMLEQLGHLLEPIKHRVANTVARAVVKNVNDSAKLQILQLLVLGDLVDDAEHFQPYGFRSVPPVGSEGVVLFPNGDFGHPMVVAVDDRASRPTDGKSGEVGLYTTEGDQIRLDQGNVISIESSGQVRIGSATAADGVIKGTTRDTAEQTFLTALDVWVSAVGGAFPTPTATFKAAIIAFAAAAGAAVSTKVKTE